MADRLRDVDCPEDIREEIQGWSSQKVAKNYGRGYSLDMKRKYLSRVWNGVESSSSVDAENSPESS